MYTALVASLHIVKAGDSAVSIAEQYGLFAPTIWNAPQNEALRARRPDMNTLLPGDELFIPERRVKPTRVETDARHRFRRKGIPAHFRLQLYDFGEPRANQKFSAEIDNHETIEGSSDAEGVVEFKLPPKARAGRLTIGEDAFVVELSFGHLDPIDELSGVQQRLTNLGYDCGGAEGQLDARTVAALRAFQLAHSADLQVSGEPDPMTVERLRELHDELADSTLAESEAG